MSVLTTRSRTKAEIAPSVRKCDAMIGADHAARTRFRADTNTAAGRTAGPENRERQGLWMKGVFKLLRAAHPRLRPNGLDPVGKGRDEAEVLAHVLLADQPDRHHSAG